MKYTLIKLDEFSGTQASIYTIKLEDENVTLLDRFLRENINSFESELKSIIVRLKAIGNNTGAREIFFKDEGKKSDGDGVCALRDTGRLRFYCIRYGTLTLLLGGGGFKPKGMREFQKDPKLTEENYLLRKISSDIRNRMKDHRISFSDNRMDFKGDLTFNTEEDE